MSDATDIGAETNNASAWEERFETQINTFFDEAIGRVPGFVDRHLKNFRRVMTRSVSPRTGMADVVVGVRNLASGFSKAVGGPGFETTTYTNDHLTRVFEREVVSPAELEALLGRLFKEFEEVMWDRVAEEVAQNYEKTREEVDAFRGRLARLMEKEVSHDPLLAQGIRSGIKLGVPATLGFVLLGGVGEGDDDSGFGSTLGGLGGVEGTSWAGAAGIGAGFLGSLAVGGLMEYTLNSLRDVKGQYIRQLNTARYVLLYGEDPDLPEGRGLLHIVRGLERQFDQLPDKAAALLEDQREADLAFGIDPVGEPVPFDQDKDS